MMICQGVSAAASARPTCLAGGAVTGFSLIEVLIALGIFGIVASSVALGFINFLRFNTNAEVRTGAVTVAQQTIEAYRYADPTSLPSSGTTSTALTMDGRSYDIDTTFCANPAFCATANNRHISVEVRYRGELQYSVETVYTQLQ